MRRTVFLLLANFLFVFILSAQDTEKRLALIIGNADYEVIAPLRNPLYDARDLGAALSKVGFDIMKYENCTRVDMFRALDDFSAKLKDYDKTLERSLQALKTDPVVRFVIMEEADFKEFRATPQFRTLLAEINKIQK